MAFFTQAIRIFLRKIVEKAKNYLLFREIMRIPSHRARGVRLRAAFAPRGFLGIPAGEKNRKSRNAKRTSPRENAPAPQRSHFQVLPTKVFSRRGAPWATSVGGVPPPLSPGSWEYCKRFFFDLQERQENSAKKRFCLDKRRKNKYNDVV